MVDEAQNDFRNGPVKLKYSGATHEIVQGRCVSGSVRTQRASQRAGTVRAMPNDTDQQSGGRDRNEHGVNSEFLH